MYCKFLYSLFLLLVQLYYSWGGFYELIPELLVLTNENSIATASSTCGNPPTHFINGTGIREICNSSDPLLNHDPINLIDGDTSTVWQSINTESPVTVTIQLARTPNVSYEVYLIEFRFSSSPLFLIIEGSNDNGQSFVPWQYFVNSSAAIGDEDLCMSQFNMATRFLPYPDDNVYSHAYCTSFPNNQIIDGQYSFIWDTIGRESITRYIFIRATHLRFTFMNFSLSNPESQYFSLAELKIYGNCICNGHSMSCSVQSGTGDYSCNCEHNTAGSKCQECQPLFNQKLYLRSYLANTFRCEKCDCMSHSNFCSYDDSIDGGICQKCEDNTEGNNCENCIEFKYRNPNTNSTDPDSCLDCNCYMPGIRDDGQCIENSTIYAFTSAGDCFCKLNIGGSKCDQCLPGTYNSSADSSTLICTDCNCSIQGTVLGSVCNNNTGYCQCADNVSGSRCDMCLDGYHSLSTKGCESCSCNPGGSHSYICNKSNGQCSCKEGIASQSCSETLPYYYIASLLSISTETEYGTDDNNNPVQIGANRSEFLNFSGQGYAKIDNSILFPLEITISATYRFLLIYNSYIANFFPFKIIFPNSNDISGVFLLHMSTYRYAFIPGTNEFLEIFVPQGIYYINVTVEYPILVDQLIAIPAQFYTADLLNNQSSQFNNDCNITTNTIQSSFCISSAFILSTGFFNGTFSCNCNLTLSNSNYCNPHSGQCSCKDGAVGINCDKCVYGYFYTSNIGCIPCACPNGAFCNQTTGQCPCEIGQSGRNCNTCENNYYQLSNNLGQMTCATCGCNSIGSIDNNCNNNTGECNCKTNIRGMNCDHCQVDYYHYSDSGCIACECNVNGSDSSECNLSSGSCTCKNLTTGDKCDSCVAGSYLLSASTPTGCSKCFCSDIITTCSPIIGHYISNAIFLNASFWYVTSLSATSSIIRENYLQIYGTTSLTINVPTSFTRLPFFTFNLNSSNFNLLLAYGGNITFSLIHTSYISLIILHSGSFIIKYELLAGNYGSVFSIPLFEYEWTILGYSNAPTRLEFIKLLTNYPTLLIPTGNYHQVGQEYTSMLTSVNIDLAKWNPNGNKLPVERCQCPQGYAGYSCQRCAAGYNRNVSGHCEMCQCNTHSDECHSLSGICQNCRDNTAGEHCEICAETFYGNSTQGSINDCLPCNCSLLTATNLSCIQNSFGQPVCYCKIGHLGDLCDRCDGNNNFYGDPKEYSNLPCSQCTCSGNINFSIPNSCNTTTGECIKCINNSTGSQCDECLPKYFGNASDKNCQPCNCSMLGSNHTLCDKLTGQCACRANIFGRQCDICLINHYNFSITGCKPCQCDTIGSNSMQCDILTGACICKSNITGRRCDMCADGFYDFSNFGCTPCNCGYAARNSICDQISGDCFCHRGAGGAKCNECLPLFENLTTSGCTPCNNCTELLSLAVEGIRLNFLKRIVSLFKQLSSYINSSEKMLKQHMVYANSVELNLDMSNNTLLDIEQRINELEAESLNKTSNLIDVNISKLKNRIIDLKIISNLVVTRLIVYSTDIRNALDYSNEVHYSVIQVLDYLFSELQFFEGFLVKSSEILNNSRYNYTVDLLASLELQEQARAIFMLSNRIQRHLNAQNQSYNRELLRHDATYLAFKEQKRAIYSLYFNLLVVNKSLFFTTELLNNISKLIQEYFNALNKVNDLIIQLSNINKTSYSTHNSSLQLVSDIEDALNGVANNSLHRGLLILISEVVSLERFQNRLRNSLTLVKARNKLIANASSSIEMSYNNTQPASTNITRALQDYKVAITLINDSCLIVSKSNNLSTVINMEAIELSSRGLYSRIVIEFSIAQNIFNIAQSINESSNRLISIKIPLVDDQIIKTNELLNQTNATLLAANHSYEFIQQKYYWINVTTNEILHRNAYFTRCIHESRLMSDIILKNIYKNYSSIQNRSIDYQMKFNIFNSTANSTFTQIRNAYEGLTVRVKNLTTSFNLYVANNNTLNHISSTANSIVGIRDRILASIAKFELVLNVTRSLSYNSPSTTMFFKTQISFFFKPSIVSGVVFYVKNLENKEMLIHLAENTIIFSVKFISQESSISLSGVNPLKWYHVLVTRDDNTIEMSLSEQNINNVRTSYINGTIGFPQGYSEGFFLKSKDLLFIAQVPSSHQLANFSKFQGCIDDLTVNYRPIPLFSPINRSVLLSACTIRPSIRDYTYNSSWFLSNGYVVLFTNELFDKDRQEYNILIKFKTFSNGILLLCQKNSDISDNSISEFSLTIMNGYIVLDFIIQNVSYSLIGSHVINGELHRVYIIRAEDIVSLFVDGKPYGSLKLPTINSFIGIIYLGGVPPQLQNSYSLSSFSGCITQFKINQKNIDLGQLSSDNASNVVNACPNSIVRGNYYFGTGYTEFNITSNDKLLNSVKLEFKTTSLSGILLFAQTKLLNNQNSFVEVGIEHGILIISYCFYINGSPRKVITKISNNLNDGQFHQLEIYLANINRILIFLDSVQYAIINDVCSINNVSCKLQVLSSLYISGIPDEIRYLSSMPKSFKGCLRNFEINDQIYLANEAKSNFGVSFYGCQSIFPPISPSISLMTSSSRPLSTSIIPTLTPTPTTSIFISTSLPISSTLMTTIIKSTFSSPTILTLFSSMPTVSVSSSETRTISSTMVLPTPFPTCQRFPPLSSLSSLESGQRFDSQNNSYFDYTVSTNELSADSIIRVDFRAVSYFGIIYYVNGATKSDFIKLELHQGHIQFSFNLGSFKDTIIKTDRKYNDGRKYRVETIRLGKLGLLTMFSISETAYIFPIEYKRSSTNDGAFYIFNLSDKFFIGGRPNLQVSADICISSFQINNINVKINHSAVQNIHPCYSKITNGATFLGNGSYLILKNSFNVGRKISITLEFKTYQVDGSILFVKNNISGDFLSLEIKQGSLIFSINNGGQNGHSSITYKPYSYFSLCNGEWHSVRIDKVNQYISLSIDDLKFSNSSGFLFTSINTKSYPLYVGSLNTQLDSNYDRLTHSFKGCIRYLSIHNRDSIEFPVFTGDEVTSSGVIIAGCII